MNATRQLHDLGQRLWLDSISRELLSSGRLSRYIREFAVSGLTSNPTIFDQAIARSDAYDEAILELARDGKSGEDLFFELALEDLTCAADLFAPIHEASGGVDGWVSLEVSPLLADDAAGTTRAALHLHARADRPNLYIKIPGTRAGIVAIEETIAAGVPVNVTLLFSREQFIAAAKAYMRGIERRIAAGSDPDVGCVASLFISRWDSAMDAELPVPLRNRLGIAMARRTLVAWRELLSSPRWMRLAAAGARPQRLLWASTGTKHPDASDTLYVEALAMADTITTLPEKTLLAFADHGVLSDALRVDGEEEELVLARFADAGVDIDALAIRLQCDGTQAFVDSWTALLARIALKSVTLTEQGRQCA